MKVKEVNLNWKAGNMHMLTFLTAQAFQEVSGFEAVIMYDYNPGMFQSLGELNFY